MPLKSLKDTDTYLELKYNDTNDKYTNDEEYFLLPGNFIEYNNLYNILFREANLIFGVDNKYIKNGFHDCFSVLVVHHEKLLSVLSYFASSPLLKDIKIKVTGPVLKRGKDGKSITVLETIIIDSSKAFDYKYADIFSSSKRKTNQIKIQR